MRSPAQTNKGFYVVGGTLRPDAPSYVERQADEELFERALAGDFCYVLTPRQMGKSSLMARTARRLQKQGIRAATVDLTLIGSEKGRDSADRWYYGIAHRIMRDTGIEANLSEWWEARKNLPALQRLTEFFSDVVLAKTSDRVIVFVDEIDTTIGLGFTDDFFAAIRACHNARATEPEFERLSFVLLGAASPSDLIKDVRRTPFNIGHRIDLTDFTFEEARPLIFGLRANNEECEPILQRILYWTGGHPYLTQKLCQEVTQEMLASCADADIDRIVEARFLTPEANREDSNLNFVRDRLIQNKKLSRKLLKLYRRIYQGKKVADAALSPVHSALKLSSVVVASKDHKLHVRNLIYEHVFTDEWAKKSMPADWNRLIAVASVVVLLLGVGVWYTVLQSRPHINILRTASEDYQLAYDAYAKLRRISGYAGKADELLAEFWDRHARMAEAREERDEALILWLRALSVQEADSRRSEVSLLASEDYKNLLFTFRHGVQINAVAFSPDGKTVLTGSDDGTARLWSVETGQPTGLPFRHREWVWGVAFSPDGKTVLTSSNGGTARMWSVETGQPTGLPLRHKDGIPEASFSPDGKRVLTASHDGTARLWNAETSQPIGLPFRHGSMIIDIAFSPDGKTVLTGSDDGTARLWNAETGQPIGLPLKHDDSVVSVAFSPDNKTVVTGSADGIARLWSVKTGMPVGLPFRHESAIHAVAFNSDAKMVIIGSADGIARMWSVETGLPVGLPFRHEDAVWGVAFSPDGKTVLTGSEDGTARLWSVETSQPTGLTLRHESLVLDTALSPDGKRVFTGSQDGTARLWDAETGQPIDPPFIHQGSVRAVTFSPNGEMLLTGSSEGIAQLWNAETGQPTGPPFRHESSIWGVAFSPDGKIVLTGSEDGTVRLWSIETGQHTVLPFRHESSIWAIAFSPDGKMLLKSSDGGTAQLLNVETGQPIGNPLISENTVQAIAFSPDSKRVLTGSFNGIAQLWDTETSQSIGQPVALKQMVRAVAFSPDNRVAISLARLWVHQLSIEGGNLAPKSSRLLNGSHTGAYRFLDDSGNRLQIITYVTRDSVRIETLQLDPTDAPPMPGDPNALLDEWQHKLGLKFDELGKIIPAWPVESRIGPVER